MILRIRVFLGTIVRASLLVACEHSASAPVLDPLTPGTIDPGDPPFYFSAENIYQLVNTPCSGLEDIARPDPDCPRVTRSEAETVYEGGCTDRFGNGWFGRVSLPSDGGGTVTYERFGNEAAGGCALDPEIRVATLMTGAIPCTGDVPVAFHADVVIEITHTDAACPDITWGLDYEGTRSGSHWSGSGRIGNDVMGRFEVRTEAQIVGFGAGGCEYEALSGRTTVEGADVAVFTYDGETDCDPQSTVTWTLNGEDQGELAGVRW